LLLACAPGGWPDDASAKVSLRWPGTKTGSSMRIALEPVPAWPATCQSSSIVQSLRGASRKPACGGAPFSAGGKCTPSKAHCELSTLDANSQRPWTM
jgi:hypothetical protein